MKIQNKTFKIKDQQVPCLELIRQLIESSATKGLTTGQMRKNFKILDKIEKSEKDLELESQEFDVVIKYLNEMVWGIQDKGIIEFDDYINDLNK